MESETQFFPQGEIFRELKQNDWLVTIKINMENGFTHTTPDSRDGGVETQCVSANASLTDLQLHITISDHLLCFCNTHHTSLPNNAISQVR